MSAMREWRGHRKHRLALGLDPGATVRPVGVEGGPRVKPEDGTVGGKTPGESRSMDPGLRRNDAVGVER
jgi:hypothetical protein